MADASEPFDFDAYVQTTCTGPCFICEMLAGNSAYRHHIVYEDDFTVAYLNKYPTLYG